MRIILTTLFAVIFLFATHAYSQNAYLNEIKKWRSDHETGLKSDSGYLTLAGLFWLKEGINTIGAGTGYDIQLTDNFKGGKFGEINFRNGKALLKTEVDYSGPEIELTSDANGAKPNVIEIGSQSFYLIKREDKYAIRLKDKNHKNRREFTGLKWFPVDARYRIAAKFEAFKEPKEILIPNVLGGDFKMKSPGILRFKIGVKSYTLQPVLDTSEGERLFIIFRDLSSKKESYGAGRFLYAEMPKEGKTWLDFNKAENPPCAFTEFATCPLPPRQNKLKVAIKSGEKRYDH